MQRWEKCPFKQMFLQKKTSSPPGNRKIINDNGMSVFLKSLKPPKKEEQQPPPGRFHNLPKQLLLNN
jgi:hypothetical protein